VSVERYQGNQTKMYININQVDKFYIYQISKVSISNKNKKESKFIIKKKKYPDQYQFPLFLNIQKNPEREEINH
jgi:hypothetical protein